MAGGYHGVNSLLGLPSAEQAEVVNQYDFLLARAQECAQMWDHAPNFLAVDFWERGDLFAVADGHPHPQKAPFGSTAV